MSSRPGAGAVLALVGGLTASCVAMTPLQARAWHAFNDCQSVARTARLAQVTVDGRIAFEAEDGDMASMKQCLRERWGYPFVN